jgi:hypothetical protein
VEYITVHGSTLKYEASLKNLATENTLNVLPAVSDEEEVYMRFAEKTLAAKTFA